MLTMRACDEHLNTIDNLSKFFGIKKGSIVQVVGSGGKTSLISHLATENPTLKTAIITTTKRWAPQNNAFILDKDSVLEIPKNTTETIEAGIRCNHAKHLGKITWLGDENYQVLKQWADIILAEADGSKNLPLKACAPYEPAYLPDANTTLVVAGMSALGKPLQDVCHRHELIDNFHTNNPENSANIPSPISGHATGNTIVTKDHVEYLLQKYYLNSGQPNIKLILNQADTPELQKVAAKIVQDLKGEFDGASAISTLNAQNALNVLD